MSRFVRSRERRDSALPVHRRVFSQEEDRALTALVASESCNTWLEIAAGMPGCSARQCRDRWTNYLAPTISLDPWTPEEDELIMRRVEECGTKWAAIAKELPRRSDNAIKNRWYTALKRKSQSGRGLPSKKKAPGDDGMDFWDKQLADLPGGTEHEEKQEHISRIFLEWF
jgi:hypothetical protein